MMDILKAKIRVAAGRALVEAAKHFNNETIPLTPIYTGKLQQAKRVEKISDTEVHCISGGKDVDSYLHRQYFGALRHLGSEKQKESLRSQPFPPNHKSGGTEKENYPAKYNYNKGRMVKMESPLWYTRAKEDAAIMRRTTAVFKNYFFTGIT